MTIPVSRRRLLATAAGVGVAGAALAWAPSAARAATTTDGALSATVTGNTITVTLTSRAFGADDLGATVRMRISTQLENAPLDPATQSLQAVAPGGARWAKPWDASRSGSWAGGNELVRTVSRDMLGNVLVSTATLTFAAGAAADVIEAVVAVSGRTAAYTVTVRPGAANQGIPTPRAAAAAGFGTLAFEDGFDNLGTIDVNHTGAPGYRWYPVLPGGGGDISAADYSVANSLLTIDPKTSNYNQQLMSNHMNNNGHSFKYGYFECRMRCAAWEVTDWTPPYSWPAWWSRSQASIMGQDVECAELDFFEGAAGASQFVGTLHIWDYQGTGKVYRTKPGVGTGDTGADLSAGFHTYGCLWEPGHVAYYFDDRLIDEFRYTATHDGVPAQNETVLRDAAGNPIKDADGNVMIDPTPAPDGVFHVLDEEASPERWGITLVLGTGVGHRMDVDWVRVWGR